MKKLILLIALSVLLYSAPGHAGGGDAPAQQHQQQHHTQN